MRAMPWVSCGLVALAMSAGPQRLAAQSHYFKASNTQLEAWFGGSLAFDGMTLVVGAPEESSGAVGVDGDQHDTSAPEAGAAYVFVRDGNSWVQQAYLKASNTGEDDHFGVSVAVVGDTIIVGAPGEDSGSAGVNGNQDDDSVSSAGAAYVFARSGLSWSQQAYLKASNSGANDSFGVDVSLHHDTLIVGAYRESSAAKGVDGDQQDDSAVAAGAAYVFTRDGAAWEQQAYLKASNTTGDDWFGASVSLWEDTLVIGAPHVSMGMPGINGDDSVPAPGHSGASYIFVRDGDQWSQEAFVKSPEPGTIDEFGTEVSIRGNTVAVGARFESFVPETVNGDVLGDLLLNAGAAYVYVRDDVSWSLEANLRASNPGQGDSFGCSVAVGDDVVLVGSQGEDGSAVGLNGIEDDAAGSAGATYVFARSAGTWSQLAYAKATNTASGYFFGSAVDVLGDVIVVGSFGERSAATGVDGSQADDGLERAGAVYLYDLNLTPWMPVGSALAGTQGWPVLAGEGSALPGSACALSLTKAVANAQALLVLAIDSTPTPFKGGTLIPSPVAGILTAMTDDAGAINRVFHWPQVPSGIAFYLQYAVADAGAVYGVALSNALRVEVP